MSGTVVQSRCASRDQALVWLTVKEVEMPLDGTIPLVVHGDLEASAAAVPAL